VTWTVVRSQIDFSSPGPAAPPASGTSLVTTATAPATATLPPASTGSTAPAAVDPGKVSHPSKPAPSVTTWKAPRPRAPKPPSDGTIVIPEPPDDDPVMPAP
jgi:hypothetical protein